MVLRRAAFSALPDLPVSSLAFYCFIYTVCCSAWPLHGSEAVHPSASPDRAGLGHGAKRDRRRKRRADRPGKQLGCIATYKSRQPGQYRCTERRDCPEIASR